MIGRNKRGNRQANMKARLGIATAVLVGGSAVGVAAVAAASHSPSTSAASSAGFTLHFRHTISEQTALASALSTWGSSQQKSFNTLAQMQPMRTFSQVMRHHTQFAAQRGIVVLATRKFLLVKSANGALHLWWLNGGTRFANVSNTMTGMAAMTGSTTAAQAAMVTNNMTPAAVTMAGSTTTVNQMAAPVAKPTTITVSTGTVTITITITSSTATVTQPVTTPTVVATPTATATAPTVAPTATATAKPTVTATATPTAVATPTATPTVVATPTPTMTATQSTFRANHGIQRGDLVLVTGFRVHGFLIAKLVLFAAPTTVTPTPTPSVTSTVTVTPTGIPTGVQPTSTSSFTGNKS
jgi:hypothetical protein